MSKEQKKAGFYPNSDGEESLCTLTKRANKSIQLLTVLEKV